MKYLMVSILFLGTVLIEVFLGSLIVLSFQQIAAAKWIPPLASALIKNLKIIFLAPLIFLMVFLGRQYLYPWASTKVFYFSTSFFVFRNILYWLIWFALSVRLKKLGSVYGGFFLVLILLTGTFWSIDWIFSLDAKFKSTIFGLIFLISSLLMAYGWTLYRLTEMPSNQNLQDLNNVHFAIVATWTYLVFIQYLVTWSGNLPEESDWYLKRLHALGKFYPVVFIVLQSAIPLFVLLMRKWKASLRFTRGIGLLSFSSQLLFALWIVIPAAQSWLQKGGKP